MSVYRTIGPVVLIFAPKHRLWVREAVLTHTHNLSLSKNKKNIKIFQLKIFDFKSSENLFILHGQVFVML